MQVKTQGKSESHAHSVQGRQHYWTLRSIGLRTAQNDTVYHDQRNVYTQGTVQNGRYAFKSSCTIVTKDAITTMNAGIRTRSGITLRNAEIIILEEDKHYCCRQSHTNGVYCTGCNSKCWTISLHHDKGRVFF